MRVFNSRVAMLMLAGSSVIAQTNITPEQQEKIKQLAAQDVATFIPEDTYALPWDPIPERNIAIKKRVWRDIDSRVAGNSVFGKDDANAQNKTLVSILLDGVFSGKIKAWSATDDRFTKLLTRDDLAAMITSGSGGVNPEQITKYQIKEDWLFLTDKNKMVVRILGLAPVREVTGPDGKVTDQPIFWVYYPDCRSYLAQYKPANNNKNWDEIFESRDFKSKITTVSDRTRQPVSATQHSTGTQLPTFVPKAVPDKH